MDDVVKVSICDTEDAIGGRMRNELDQFGFGGGQLM